ncbi:MAG: CPBP family intramembrane metalloprotease [Flavobacteriales bacterium]|nr:CPBP family intramembrane metalloprotease [Flavobacteriales bacterium]MCB0788950.1 CPBP family intramembrane metalloprotease [Flavobacteriales bacterium]MCB0811255.1 CPBP family intramembrane metalloprotease [Flavobacteriales bacterium]
MCELSAWGLAQSVAETLVLLVLVPLSATIARARTDLRTLLLAGGAHLLIKGLLFQGFGNWSYPDIIPGRYNWEGKAVAILGTLLFASVLSRTRQTSLGKILPFAIPKDRSTVRWTLVIAILMGLYAWAYLGGVRPGGWHEWGYQLSMPAMEEELFYRGLLFFLVIASIRGGVEKARELAAATVITLVFATSHGLRVGPELSFQFDPWSALYSGIVGSLLMWMRVRSRSLLPPMLLHGWSNLAPYLI